MNIKLLTGGLDFEWVHGILDVSELLVEIILSRGRGRSSFFTVFFTEGCTGVGPDGARLLEGAGNRGANAPGAAGDQGDLAGEKEGKLGHVAGFPFLEW